jgi:hypothetical protein
MPASGHGPSVEAIEREIEITFITSARLSLQTTYKNEREAREETEITYNNTHIPSLIKMTSVQWDHLRIFILFFI